MLLNDKRVDITKEAKDGYTPFYSACFKGHVVKLLLNDSRVVDINKVDSFGLLAKKDLLK